MRSSSIKSLAATLSVVVVLSVAAPAAQARPAQPRGKNSIVKMIRVLVSRVLGGFTSNAGPSIPVPGATTEPANTVPVTPLPIDDDQS